MRLLVAPLEFKGTLTARQAAAAIDRGIHRARPGVEADLLPLADGGPGTVEAVLAATGGTRVQTRVSDPLGRPVEATWAVIGSGGTSRTAVIEMAAASGLSLLSPEERDPRRASTSGTGQLIAAALGAGCRTLIIGAGGSATNDGGAGALVPSARASSTNTGGRCLPAEPRSGPSRASISPRWIRTSARHR